MDVVVRLAERDLAPDLAQVQLDASVVVYGRIFPQEAPTPTIDEVTAQWEQRLGAERDLGQRAFVAHDADVVVGVVLAGPDAIQRHVGHLARLYVTPDRWERGIGTILYSAATNHLRAAGFQETTLWVLEHNDRARRWYERLGWRSTGERKPVYPPGSIDDLRYRTLLEPGSRRAD